MYRFQKKIPVSLIVTCAVYFLLPGNLPAQVEKFGWPEEQPAGPVKSRTVSTLSPEGLVLGKVVMEFSPEKKLLKTSYSGYGGEFRGSTQFSYDSRGWRISAVSAFPSYGQEYTTLYKSDSAGNLTEATELNESGEVSFRYLWDWFPSGSLKSLRVFRSGGEEFFRIDFIEGKPGVRESFTYDSSTSGKGRGLLTYDAQGRLESEPYFNADGGLSYLRYGYDAQGRVIKEELISSQGEPDGWIEYLRDSRGNWTESRQYVTGGLLINTRKVQLEYFP